jgi:hypothetical protein
VLPDTQRNINVDSWKYGSSGYTYKRHTEQRRVVAVEADGTVTLDQPLQYNHSDVPLAMVTRSVVLKSDVSGGGVAGHIMVAGKSPMLTGWVGGWVGCVRDSRGGSRRTRELCQHNLGMMQCWMDILPVGCLAIGSR